MKLRNRKRYLSHLKARPHRWLFELSENVTTQYGLDLVAEISAALIAEIEATRNDQ